MFAYCGNNPVNGSDPTGRVYIEQHPLTYMDESNGFGVEMSQDFYNPYYCLRYSYEIIDVYGDGNSFVGMDAERIAMEIYSHAVAHSIGIGLKSKAKNIQVFADVGNDILTHTTIIDVNADEKAGRLIGYKFIWYSSTSRYGRAAASIKNNSFHRGGPMKQEIK